MLPVKNRVDAARLRAHIEELLIAYGVPASHAEVMADHFIWASLRGVDSHGVSHVPRYIELFDSGEAKLSPAMVERRLKPAVSLIEADFAPGPVALIRAVELGVEMATEQGVGWVQVRQTVHAGAIGYYVERVAKAGMVGVMMLAGMPNMAYPGARTAGVATSPLAIAIPSVGQAPFLLDMATAIIAFGKLAQYRMRGETLPENSAVSAEGRVTTDPQLAKWPLALGGMKGAGLSLAFELLTSVLAGAPTLAPVHRKVEGARRHRQNATLIVLDPQVFGGREVFSTAVAETLDAIRSLPATEPGGVVGVPGDRGSARAAERAQSGIPLSATILTRLAELAAAKGMDPITARD